MAAGGARRAEPRDLLPHPAQSLPGLTCAPRWSRNWEPSGTGGAGRQGLGAGGRALHPDVWWCFARTSACLPASARWDPRPSPAPPTTANHRPRSPGPPSSLLPAQYLAPVAILLQLSLPELRGAWFLPTGPTPGTLKRPSSPSGPHLWLCGKSAGFGVGPGFAPSLSQET